MNMTFVWGNQFWAFVEIVKVNNMYHIVLTLGSGDMWHLFKLVNGKSKSKFPYKVDAQYISTCLHHANVGVFDVTIKSQMLLN